MKIFLKLITFFPILFYSCVNTDIQKIELSDPIDISVALGQLNYNGANFFELLAGDTSNNDKEADTNDDTDKKEEELKISDILKTNQTDNSLFIDYSFDLDDISISDIKSFSFGTSESEIGDISGEDITVKQSVAIADTMGVDGDGDTIIDNAVQVGADYYIFSDTTFTVTNDLTITTLELATIRTGQLNIFLTNNTLTDITELEIEIQDSDGNTLLTLDNGGAQYTANASSTISTDHVVTLTADNQLTITSALNNFKATSPLKLVISGKQKASSTYANAVATDRIEIDTATKQNNAKAQSVEVFFEIKDPIISEGKFQVPSKTIESSSEKNVTDEFRGGAFKNTQLVAEVKNQTSLSGNLKIFISNINKKDTGKTLELDLNLTPHNTLRNLTDMDQYVIDAANKKYEYKYSFITTDTGNNNIGVTNTDKVVIDFKLEDKTDANNNLQYEYLDVSFQKKSKTIKRKKIDLPDFASLLGEDFIINDKSKLEISIEFPFATTKGVELKIDTPSAITTSQSNDFNEELTNIIVFDNISDLINDDKNELTMYGDVTVGLKAETPEKITRIDGKTSNIKINANALIPLKLIPKKDYQHIIASQVDKVSSIEGKLKKAILYLDIENKTALPMKLNFAFSRTEKKDDANAELLLLVQNKNIGSKRNTLVEIKLGDDEVEYLQKDFYIQADVILEKDGNKDIIFGTDDLIKISTRADMKLLLDF